MSVYAYDHPEQLSRVAPRFCCEKAPIRRRSYVFGEGDKKNYLHSRSSFIGAFLAAAAAWYLADDAFDATDGSDWLVTTLRLRRSAASAAKSTGMSSLFF